MGRKRAGQTAKMTMLLCHFPCVPKIFKVIGLWCFFFEFWRIWFVCTAKSNHKGHQFFWVAVQHNWLPLIPYLYYSCKKSSISWKINFLRNFKRAQKIKSWKIEYAFAWINFDCTLFEFLPVYNSVEWLPWWRNNGQ